MKSSLKFREDQKPLFRAKVPLSILGIPFQSSLSAGDTKELSLGLGTLFESGPSLRLSYRPNDPLKPFSLSLKSGIGPLGSPIDAPLTISAEFNPLSNSPSFLLHFKPRFGDFSIRKSHTSSSSPNLVTRSNDYVSSEDDDGSVEVVDPVIGGDYLAVAKRSTSSLASAVDSALAGMELGARTVLPIRNGAVLKVRWGVRFPEDVKSLLGFGMNPTAGISSRGIPLLVMNKIGIEHVVGEKEEKRKVGPGGEGDVENTCFVVRRQLKGLQVESERMRRAMDEFRSEFGKRSANGTGKVVAPLQGGDQGGEESKKAVKGSIAA